MNDGTLTADIGHTARLLDMGTTVGGPWNSKPPGPAVLSS